MTSPTLEDTEQRIKVLLVRDFNVDPAKLTADARLEELGVDSIGIAELIFNVEDEFGLKLADVAVQLTTFGEIVQFIDQAVVDKRTAGPSPAAPPGVPTAT